jgi:hypothetical protein
MLVESLRFIRDVSKDILAALLPVKGHGEPEPSDG